MADMTDPLPKFEAARAGAVARAAAASALALAAATGLTLSPAPAAMAQADAQSSTGAAASDWAPAPKSRARLVSGGAIENGAYRVGVEVALEGEALTYWRNPGDSGVPPEFDFSGSANLASAEVAYPAPERHDEAGSEVFGWRGAVIFPVTVKPKDASKPVTLDLTLRYAACEKICIPSDGRMRLTLVPAGAPAPHADRIAKWAALTPRPAKEAGVALRVEPVAGADKPTWSVSTSPSEAGSDLFAEGEDGWFFDTRPAGDAFRLVLADRPARATGPASVRLTLRRPSGAVEFETKLDAGKPAP